MSYIIKSIPGFNAKLSDCPFCGGVPEWVLVPGEDFIMRCSNCHASTQVAQMDPAEAAADWNSKKIKDDNFTITEDTLIDEFIASGILEIRFSEYSNFDKFPQIENGFLCSDTVIRTEKNILVLESCHGVFDYSEISEYGEIYSRAIINDTTPIKLEKSHWNGGMLISLSFVCRNERITVSADAKYDCTKVEINNI